MTLIEKLRQEIASCDELFAKIDEKYDLLYATQGGVIAGLKLALSMAVSQNDWILVDEQYPEPNSYVLVFFGGKHIDIALYTANKSILVDGQFVDFEKPVPMFYLSTGSIVKNATHWQPLPQLPKQ